MTVKVPKKEGKRRVGVIRTVKGKKTMYVVRRGKGGDMLAEEITIMKPLPVNW